jgi:hypothetical protein
MNPSPSPTAVLRRPTGARAAAVACAIVLATLAGSPAGAQVYRWVDAEGVIHLSSEKPPAGVKAERINVGSSSRGTTAGASGRSASGSAGSAPSTSASRAPSGSTVASSDREALLGRLRTRECVIALEALERKTGGTEATSADEIRRLKQTADLNCSQDPARRREQEEMALQLRAANSPACVAARSQLAEMLTPDSGVPREQIKAQQTFVEKHCTAPVR